MYDACQKPPLTAEKERKGVYAERTALHKLLSANRQGSKRLYSTVNADMPMIFQQYGTMNK